MSIWLIESFIFRWIVSNYSMCFDYSIVVGLHFFSNVSWFVGYYSNDELKMFTSGRSCVWSFMKAWQKKKLRLDNTLTTFFFILQAFISLSFTYFRCSLKVLSWNLVRLLSMSYSTILIRSMVSTRILLCLSINSMTNMNTNNQFFFIIIFPKVVASIGCLLLLTKILDFNSRLMFTRHWGFVTWSRRLWGNFI